MESESEKAMNELKEIEKASKIKISCATIFPGQDVRDIKNNIVIAGSGILVFIDPYPLANWAHECYYILIKNGCDVQRAKHNWPPADEHDLSPLP